MTPPLYLFVALVLLNVADVLTTLRILNFDDGEERAPLVQWAMDRYGALEGMLVLKVPLLIPLGVLLATGVEYFEVYDVRIWFTWMLLPLITWYVWVVYNNVCVLKGLKP